MGWRARGKALHRGKTRLEKKVPSLLTSSHSPSRLIASVGHHSLAHKPGPNTLHTQLCPVPSPLPCPGRAQPQLSTAGTALRFLQGFTAGFHFSCSKAVPVQGQVETVAQSGAHGMHHQGDVFGVWARQDDLCNPCPNDRRPLFANLPCVWVGSPEPWGLMFECAWVRGVLQGCNIAMQVTKREWAGQPALTVPSGRRHVSAGELGPPTEPLQLTPETLPKGHTKI